MDKINGEMIPCIKAEAIEAIKSDVSEIKDTNEQILKCQRRIEMLILGDQEAKIEGIAQKADRHDKDIESGRRLIYIGFGMWLLAFAVFTIIVALK